jgi:hypothetical protein
MEIRIGRCAHSCCATGRDFVHEEEIHSRVRVVEDVLIREDFGADAWKPGMAEDAYSAWAAKYYDPKVAEDESPEVFSPLRQLFYESVASEERLEQAKAFLAAQLLRRQRAFRQIKESDDSDGEIRLVLYADRIGNRLIEVRDPNFSYAEMDDARTALLTRLQELEQPEEAQPQETPENHGSSEDIESTREAAPEE